MEKNIFENAYFGKSYKTRDGRKAIYLGNDGTLSFHHRLNIEGDYVIGCFNEFGVRASNNEYSADDIVSEWQEEINEEVLCETALNFVVDFLNKNEICLVPYKNYNEIGDGTWNNNHFNCNDLTEAFEAGYRSKALNK